ncbi:unnamed protein product [Rangifer tarandus platyrhynchus]|uniref:Uncharacterized protein n=1 Tax=Rangifer tarandus platyrhynchus TaxID=3082113 RepID=A0AC59Z0J8_RANTA
MGGFVPRMCHTLRRTPPGPSGTPPALGNQGLLWEPTLATRHLSGLREVAAEPRSVSCSKSTPKRSGDDMSPQPLPRLTTPLSMNPPPLSPSGIPLIV